MNCDEQAILRIGKTDNVGIALTPIASGQEIPAHDIVARNNIRRGHKIALESISVGQLARKYNQAIGIASADIAPGDHVHIHNLTGDGLNARLAASQPPAPLLTLDDLPDHFMGYNRPDGAVGTRNYVALLSTVNCSATVCRAVVEHFNRDDVSKAYPNVDGVIAFTHGLGCGVDSRSLGYDVLQRTLMGSAFNPNVGATVIVGLGCETNQARFMMERCGVSECNTLRSFSIQQAGGTRASIDKAVAHIEEMLPEVNAQRRISLPVRGLRVALQCGGSDAYSGFTANPALGVASDILVAMGGTAILSETPEIYGAEHMLAGRAKSPDVSDKLMGLINWWRNYCENAGTSMDNNPSYGNKIGGLTTIYEKSLGAVAKSGQSPLQAVYGYGERVTETGLVFVDTPGYDPVCSTGQIASGANLMCFTTGRGSVSGFKPVPTLKLATNTPMYQRMQGDMDINCGTILQGETIESAGRDIFHAMVATASGRRTLSELNGFGDNEFVPWQIGPTL